MTTVLEEIRRQAHWCGEFGSHFTQQLLLRASDDLEAGGVVARLTEGWTGSPLADAVSLRLAGALHAAALTNRDAQLAAAWPHADPDWTMDKAWPIARAFLEREEAYVRDFMRSPPQTNETGRATGLAAGFMHLIAHNAPQPFHMLELGASAGLNLNWDRFRYAHAPWSRTAGEGPLIPTQVTGQPPPWRDIAIASRAACDQNPLDPRDPAQRLRLRAYIWADQTARLERLNAAIDLAVASGGTVEKADAAEWSARKLSSLQPGTTVVYHSVFYQYPPKEVRAAIASAIEEAGRRATRDAQLAWVRFEPEGLLGGSRESVRYVLNVVHWNGGARQEETLAHVDPHGRFMEWFEKSVALA